MNANVPAPLPGSGLPSFLSRDGVRYGSDAKWTANSGWTDRDGLPLPPIMLVTGYATMLERWREEEGRNVVEYKIGHPLPDPEVLNAAIPISEWKIGLSGKPERPWRLLYAVYMIEPTKGLVFTWKNTTYGAQQAFEALVESIVVRQMLCGERAYASVRAAKRLLAHADPVDQRIRGWGRIYGGAPGRWSSPGPQLHNLRRNDAEYPASLIDALLAGDHAELARWGNPLAVAAQLSRAALCAKSGHILMCGDLGAIESRLNAWHAGETWKLDVYRQYDTTGDKSREPYRVIAAQMLRKNSVDLITAERQLGKNADLACGFGGSVGAWRRIAGDDGRSDAEVLAIIRQWRDAHPAIRTFWRELAQAARVAIRTGHPILVAPAPRPPIIAAFDGYALTLTLPSGRTIVYPGAHLVPNTKFEDGDPDIEFFDNARGQWKPTRAWFGTLVENVVQGTARDLLAAALLRFEARGLPVVFHCHDEVVIEVPEGSITKAEVLAILLEAPPWTTGLPLGGKVHSGSLYLAAPATGEPPAPKEEIIDLMVDHALDTFIAGAEPLPATKEIERGAEEDFLASLGETIAPLTDLVTLPMDASSHVACPFHDDPRPSCKIYTDHWYCFGCGEHGGRMDWLMRVEGMTKAEAIAALQDWSGPIQIDQEQDIASRRALAKDIWLAAQPLAGTIGERYLAETRGIDVGKLPSSIHNALRFHPRCIFGARAQARRPALAHHVHRTAPMGPRVLINGIWYYTLG